MNRSTQAPLGGRPDKLPWWLRRPLNTSPREHRIHDWFYEGLHIPSSTAPPKQHTAHWTKIMCLTGVDYFSTLAYQPSIAFLAAGALAPIATLVLISLTLFGALPMYGRIADMSPHGQGSIFVLERLFPR